jgi:signal transduction histidine kinase
LSQATVPDLRPPEDLEAFDRRWPALVGGAFAVILALLWFLFAEHTVFERRQALEAVAQRDANFATAMGFYMLRVLKNAEAVDTYVVALRRGRPVARQDLEQMLADRVSHNDVLSGLAVCTPSGAVLDSGMGEVRVTGEDCARLRSVPHGRKAYVADALQSRGRHFIPVALAYEDPAGGEGLVVALVPTTILLDVALAAQLQDDVRVEVRGAGGVLVRWKTGDGAAAIFAPEPEPEAATPADGTRLSTHRELRDWGLEITVATLESDGLAAYRQRRQADLLACIVASAAILVLGGVLVRGQRKTALHAACLRQARNELAALNERLEGEVEERTAQLGNAYRELETFSNAVAHDVRAPLAAIQAFSEVLEPVLAQAGSEKDQHYLRRIQAGAKQMRRLTDHLLALGKVGASPLRIVSVDLSALARDILQRMKEVEPLRAVDVHVEPSLRASADPMLVRQVLENLLGNAWKFTARTSGARIRVGRLPPDEHGGWQTFFVGDNGEGFDSENATELFKPFRRMHAENEFPGSGVGLATVRRIISLHGGGVWCEARPQQGATFYFTLKDAT